MNFNLVGQTIKRDNVSSSMRASPGVVGHQRTRAIKVMPAKQASGYTTKIDVPLASTNRATSVILAG